MIFVLPGSKLFDSLKRINIASKESWENKLTTKQSQAISLNKVLLLMQARRLGEAADAFRVLFVF